MILVDSDMLQNDRLNQFEYLLLEILKFANMNIPVEHACNLSFFNTSQKFNIENSTVRDMVTRCCHNKISDFHKTILGLYSHNANLFRTKYYSCIPTSYHKKFNDIYSKFESVNFNEDDVDDKFIKILKRFVKLNKYEKKDFINNLKSYLSI